MRQQHTFTEDVIPVLEFVERRAICKAYKVALILLKA